MSSAGGHPITRALWRRRGTVATWLLDRPQSCRHINSIYHHKPFLFYCALARSHFVSSAATVQVLALPQDHVHSRSSSSSNTKSNSKTTCYYERNNKNNYRKSELKTQRPHDPLKERLSMLDVEKATRKDLDTIWQLFLQRDTQSTTTTKLQPLFPPLVTMLFRLVAKKGTLDMMDTLHKYFLHPDLLLRTEDIEWVIFANIRANKTGRAHRILNDMYKVGQTPTLGTYHHFIKEHSKYFYNKRRRNIIQHLLDEMRQCGVQPNIDIYMQLLMSEAKHGSDRERVQGWLDQMVALEMAARGCNNKRTYHRFQKLVRLLSQHGHPGLYTVLRTGMDVGLTFDKDFLNKAAGIYARRGDANDILDFIRQHKMQSVDTYHTFIHAYLTQQPKCIDAAIQAFQWMLQDGIVVEPSIYHSFLLAYTQHNVTIEDDELRIKTLRQLFQASIHSSQHGKPIPDGIVERLFNFYLQKHILPEAEQIYWELRHGEHRLSRRIQGCVFNTITAFAQKQQLLSAFSLTYDLLANDYWPNSKALCAIIKACGAQRDLEAAEQLIVIMEDIASDKVKPVVYTTLLREQAIASRRKQEEEEEKAIHKSSSSSSSCTQVE
ncbi:hypothetical protein BDA99DRAFT_508520 [Phascolomyces articulosus]|uniref:Pentatricopeptide repeat-containing protein n=1 Tax=Phascolomyces articulosus TaxID=60185 RepID=A0AAD5PFX8_9FUNG|nr:hypothetical protein BDA99DRAFT_508520 [Phascolomyces articulosus]